MAQVMPTTTTRTGYTAGRISPILYYENSAGIISIPPTTADALRIRGPMFCRGFTLHEAATLPEARQLQRRLQSQVASDSAAAREHDAFVYGQLRSEIRSRLRTRMSSATTSQYERDFIREYLTHSEAKYAQNLRRLRTPDSYITALEFDSTSARHHLADITDKIPTSQDTACVRCRSYRKVQGSELCFRCALASGEPAHAR